jgi:hypothetical protein
MKTRLGFGVGVAVALAMTLAPASVLAAHNGWTKVDHQRVSTTDPDTNFCATGETVNIVVHGVQNTWTNANGAQKVTGHLRTRYTNPANGQWAVASSSGRTMSWRVDNPDGSYTLITSYRGQMVKIRVHGHHAVRLHDAGYVTYLAHYDATDTYLGTDVKEHGQRAASDFCTVMTDVLGL